MIHRREIDVISKGKSVLVVWNCEFRRRVDGEFPSFDVIWLLVCTFVVFAVNHFYSEVVRVPVSSQIILVLFSNMQCDVSARNFFFSFSSSVQSRENNGRQGRWFFLETVVWRICARGVKCRPGFLISEMEWKGGAEETILECFSVSESRNNCGISDPIVMMASFFTSHLAPIHSSSSVLTIHMSLLRISGAGKAQKIDVVDRDEVQSKADMAGTFKDAPVFSLSPSFSLAPLHLVPLLFHLCVLFSHFPSLHLLAFPENLLPSISLSFPFFHWQSIRLKVSSLNYRVSEVWRQKIER